MLLFIQLASKSNLGQENGLWGPSKEAKIHLGAFDCSVHYRGSLAQLAQCISNLEKPSFSTSMFTCYLFDFLCWPPWRNAYCARPSNYSFLDSEPEDDNLDEQTNRKLSTPIFVPVKIADRDGMDKSSGTESDDSSLKNVRFNKVAEVRHLSEMEAADALLARLSYHASVRATLKL